MDFETPTTAKEGAPRLSYQLSGMQSRRERGRNEVSKLSIIKKKTKKQKNKIRVSTQIYTSEL